MDVLNETKEKIQNECLNKWCENNKHGTAELVTGLGKTFLALKALLTFPKYQNDILHLFLAEQKDRLSDLNKDIIKFNKIYNCNILEEYNLQFQCYQTVRNWKDYKLGLVIADEVHDCISPENYKFFINNTFEGVLGLTAKFNGERYYDFSNHKNLVSYFGKLFVNKLEMLNKIAPIIYTYTLSQAKKDKTSRNLNIYIIEHELDNITKNIKSGSKNKPFYQTELAKYNYLNKLYNDLYNMSPLKDEDVYEFEEKKQIKLYSLINQRCKFLYTLPSRFKLVKFLLKYINEKTIIFGNDVDELLKITPNVVSSRNKDSENNHIRDLFDKGTINIIGSFKKLKQGANLSNVAVCILHSYYSSEIDLIQRIGRLRQDGDKDGMVIIFVAKNTQEEVWLNKMLVNTENLNIIRCNVNEFITKKYYEIS